jgi:hypothetical protein
MLIRFLRISTFVATLLIVTASNITDNKLEANGSFPASTVLALQKPDDTFGCVEASAARQTFDLPARGIRSTLRLFSSALTLKAHRCGVQLIVAGHVKFRHASNAPPVLFS